MGIFLDKHSDNIDWLIWELEENEEELREILNCPDLEKQSSLIKTDKRKKEFLCSRILLKKLFGQCIPLKYKDFGAPYIESSEWNISITHSGKYVALARSKYPLGIDIEQISEKLDRTKHKYCSKNELRNIDNSQKWYHLALHWSAKESVYKLVGNEALIFDTEMLINAFTPQQEGYFKMNLNSPKTQQQLDIYYQKINEYVFTYSFI